MDDHLSKENMMSFNSMNLFLEIYTKDRYKFNYNNWNNLSN